ncbi:hypothetical protein B0T24DRAFT_653029 [Lasiosphaeria ovina]|uniref:DNA 3'-5' helicase n=1 Tax=Lasiosphaeria ovina TaxID=92902 RepID=A0AAE0MYD6_9PEZI|nr:hypothetical protein B0T24DRAFT_653029 [Lasiosphaeria ovina]
MQRLVYQQGDTILITVTGYGKSAVLYTIFTLTEKITRDDITKNVPNSNPVWIDADTHLKVFKEGLYSYILLSPEQAQSPKFKAVLRDPAFYEKIGLFAIDELYVVGEWREFRADFTMPWFGYTATLDKDNQSYILEHTGFDLRRLKIIRTSIDCLEISIAVQPLLRGSIRDYRRLHFLIRGATTAIVQNIPKTIVYLDSKPQLIAARYTLLRYLKRQCGFSKSFARKADKDIIFKDFASKTDCRIILATVSLGMGMDIPDVERVVQFGLPPSPSLADIWQRFKRAMRKKEGQGMVYLFAPYWAFDHLGSTEKQVKIPKARQPRSRKQPHAPVVSNRLREFVLAERDVVDDETASQASQGSQASNASQGSTESQTLYGFNKKVKWTRSDLVQREKLDPVFKGFLNASCFRKYALEYLQEPLDDPFLEYKRPVTDQLCCNACIHELGEIPPLQARPKGDEKPTAGSLAGMALQQLSTWCKAEAQVLVPIEQRRFDIIGDIWMDSRLQYTITRLFSQTQRELEKKVPGLKDWEYFESKGADLIRFYFDSLDTIHELWGVEKERKANEKESRRGVVDSPESRKRSATAEPSAESPASKR